MFCQLTFKLIEKGEKMTFNIYSYYCDFINEKNSYCSDETVSYYNDCVSRFFAWLKNEKSLKLDSVPENYFDRTVFIEYISYLRKLLIKNVSINTYFRGVKVFFSWLEEREILMNESKKCKLPKKDNESIVPLSASEIDRIDNLFNLNSLLGVRNYCIFHLMLDCGLRRAEVRRLTDSSFDFDLNIIFVSGKGYKKRVVPLPIFLKKELLKYRDFYRPEKNHNYFFILNNGNPLTNDSIKMFFERLKLRAGIPRIHAHLLRHTFATSYILGGGNLEFLRLLMGHSDYTITQNYLHIANTVSLMQFDFYELDSVFFKMYRKGVI